MQNIKQTVSLSMVLAWAIHQVSLLMMSLKPRHSAEQIAEIVARSGNPAGT